MTAPTCAEKTDHTLDARGSQDPMIQSGWICNRSGNNYLLLWG